MRIVNAERLIMRQRERMRVVNAERLIVRQRERVWLSECELLAECELERVLKWDPVRKCGRVCIGESVYVRLSCCDSVVCEQRDALDIWLLVAVVERFGLAQQLRVCLSERVSVRVALFV